MNTWSVRKAIPEDIPFIYSSWLNSYKYDSTVGFSVRKGLFFSEYRTILDYILSQSDTKVLVACDPDYPNTIFGYLVYQPNTIHYAFTKESFRNLGIQTSLYNAAELGAGAVYYTHSTYSLRDMIHNHPDLVYDPFRLYRRSNE